jgi:hypothetical protein
MDCGLWISDFGLQIVNYGLWIAQFIENQSINMGSRDKGEFLRRFRRLDPPIYADLGSSKAKSA